ncbi:MAG: anion transporter, partial [Muribaculaceae bacterium]|nr:anion transporter [Muribaculaceae bacterium]
MSDKNSFDKKRRAIGALLGPIMAIAIWFMPINAISASAHHLLAIMALVAIWWVTEPVPIPVT